MEAEAETAKSPISLVSCVVLILLIAAVLGIGSFFAFRMIHERRQAAEFADHIQVHDGARPADATPDALDRALPPLAGEGLRFLARPTFSLDDYAVAIAPRPGGDADGVLLVYSRASRAVASRRFTLPAGAYGDLTRSIDQTLAQPETRPRYCTDGIVYVVERSSGGRRRWGTNGVSCPLRYARVAAILRQALARHAPGPDLPARDNWSKLD